MQARPASELAQNAASAGLPSRCTRDSKDHQGWWVTRASLGRIWGRWGGMEGACSPGGMSPPPTHSFIHSLAHLALLEAPSGPGDGGGSSLPPTLRGSRPLLLSCPKQGSPFQGCNRTEADWERGKGFGLARPPLSRNVPFRRVDMGASCLARPAFLLSLEDTPAHTLLSGQALATRPPTLFPRAAHSAAVQWPVLPGGPVAVVTEALSLLRPWKSFLIFCLISYGQPLPHPHTKPRPCQQTSPPQSYPSPPPPAQPLLQLCLQPGNPCLLPSFACNPLPHNAHHSPANLPGLLPSLTFHPSSLSSWAERSHCCDCPLPAGWGPLQVRRAPNHASAWLWPTVTHNLTTPLPQLGLC